MIMHLKHCAFQEHGVLFFHRIYHYDNTNGYTQLSNFSLNVVTDSATLITSWNAGAMTEA